MESNDAVERLAAPLDQRCLLRVSRVDLANCELSQLCVTMRKSPHAAQSEVVRSLARQLYAPEVFQASRATSRSGSYLPDKQNRCERRVAS
jgi:uncharacterized protein YhdP